MIEIKDVSIENFRSIAGTPLDFTVSNYCVIVGANNSGKSNILRALDLFFNGTVDGLPYSADRDFPKCPTLGNRAQTKITITLKYEPSKDVTLEKSIQQLETESGQTRLSGDLVRLRLEYSRRDTLQWKFFSKAGLRSIRAALVVPVVDAVRTSVRFKYLAVGRDILETVKTELSDELVRTIFSGWSGAVKARREINEAIDQLICKLQPRLQDSGIEITDAIQAVFGEIKRLDLRLPFSNLETMLPTLVPVVRDSYETPLNQKGAGIQTSTLLFLLKYLADHHPQRHHARVTYLWAIEEPESYLHPLRQKGMAEVLKQFSEQVQTFITTHSAHFVPRHTGASVLIVGKESSSPFSTILSGDDFELARQTLGVTLLDSMYLYPHNIVVEGPSDEIMLAGAWAKLYEGDRVRVDPSDIKFLPGGNANGACTLYESLMVFGDAKEVDIALMIDGDSAGDKALRGLLNRTREHLGLKANRDYFQLEKTTEWLASPRVMEHLNTEYPASTTLKVNTSNEITDFNIHEGNKKKIAKTLVEESQIDDLKYFQKIIGKIESKFTTSS